MQQLDPLSRYPVKSSPIASLHRWVDLHEKALFVPDHLYVAAEREYQARTAPLVDAQRMALFAEIQEKSQQDLLAYKHRREIEESIADYLDHHKMYFDVSVELRSCRDGGTLGYCCHHGEHKRIIAWDHKCGYNRLCPDEAREEQMRLTERYVPAIETWRRASKSRQVQYCVLTWPNIPVGELHRYKREMAKRVSKWLKSKHCKAVKGALCVQEDPLSAHGDWNLHTNLILLVDGRFKWSDARAAWYKLTRHLFPRSTSDFQTHFTNVPPHKLVRTVLELIKYSAKHVSAKQLEEGKEVDAPGITDWPPERFSEWWEAGKKFRRTRSYGVLFRVPEPEDDLPYDEVEWVGRVTYRRGVGYSVSISSIPGHNSTTSDEGKGGKSSYNGRTGPPNQQVEVLSHGKSDNR